MKLKPAKHLKWPGNLLSIIFEKEIKYPITNERTALIENVIKETMNVREAAVLFMYYKDALTSGKIGEKYDVTSVRIRQILYKAGRSNRTRG
jgi:DNA-directed RNA polymerase sigma subunit (sigma70/sigma32)